MADEADVIVKLEPDELPALGDAKTAVEKKEEPIVKVAGDTKKQDDAVNDLVSQYKEEIEREKKQKAEADKRAFAAESEARRAKAEAAESATRVINSNLDTVNTALQSAQVEIEAAKRDIAIAGANGDYEAQAAAYERLAGAKSLALRYDEAKADLEARQKKPDVLRTQSAEADPVEAYIQGRSAPTQRWLREHTDFITDNRKQAKLTAAHYSAVGDGLQPDTDDYFEHVEKFLGLKTEEGEANGGSVTVKEHKRAAPKIPAAPVGGGSVGGASSTSSNEVRLTAREAAAATDGTHVWNYDDPSPQKKFKRGDPIGVQEFARRKLEMQKQGAYDRSYETQ